MILFRVPKITLGYFMFFIVLNCSAPPENADSDLINNYISKARLFFENEEMDSSLYYIDRCLKIDRNCTQANYLRGKIFLYKDGVYNRRISAASLKKAVLMDNDNPEYHYSLGITLERQGFLKNALREFKKSAQYDSNDPRPLLKIAEISKRIGLRFDDKDYFEKSAEAAIKAARISKDPKCYYEQAVALYHLKMFELSAQSLEQALETVQDSADMIEYELLLGTNLVRTAMFDSAYAVFESARRKMGNIRRAEMDSPKFLMTPDNYNVLTKESLFRQKRILKQFWGELDSDPTTNVNERKLEHYSRIIHSKITFSVPDKKIDGRKTKRGEMYIRYGPPSSQKYVLGASGSGRDVPKWVWTYNHFEQPITLVFADTFLDGDFDFPFPSSAWTVADYDNDPSLIAERMRNSSPQAYSMKIGSGPLKYLYMPMQFKASRGKTEVEIFLAIPYTEMKFERRGEFAYSTIEWRQVLRYPSWKLADSANVERTYEIQASQADNPNMDITDRLVLSAYPDTLVFAISLRDPRSDHVGLGRTGMRLRNFYTGKVELSDMVLARRIDRPVDKVNFSRKDLRILSNLDSRYFAGEPVWLYFEIYNLEKGPDGKTSYTINQKITEKKAGGLFSAIKGTIAGGDLLEVITSYDGSSIHTEENRILTLELGQFEAGEYRITIEVADKISKKASSVSESIVLYRD